MTVHMASCTSQTMPFLIFILHFPAFASLTFQSSPRRGPACGKSCKPSSNSSAWLYMEMWRILAASTFGSLLGQYSPILVCDMSRPHYNENLCERVGEQWFDCTFHSHHPVNLAHPNWQDDTCLSNAVADESIRRCDLRSFPIYILNSTGAAHVVEAVRFAGGTGIRLVVSGGAHDLRSR
jgi:hypothetical protein